MKKYSYFGTEIYQTFEARKKQRLRFFSSLYNSYRLPDSDTFLHGLTDLIDFGAFSIVDAQCAFYEYYRHLPGLYYGKALYLLCLRDDFDVPLESFQTIKISELWLDLKSPNTIKSPLVVLGFNL